MFGFIYEKQWFFGFFKTVFSLKKIIEGKIGPSVFDVENP